MKHLKDMRTVQVQPLAGARYAMLRLVCADGSPLPQCAPGTFAQVATGAPGVMLRRPISICRVDADGGLWLLVRRAGPGTARLCDARPGDTFSMLLPLGQGFSLPPKDSDERLLLVGGGVGIAPLLALTDTLLSRGCHPRWLIGARTEADLLLIEEARSLGIDVHITTDDGSDGVRGVVTAHPVLQQPLDRIYCCGPAPMMKAVAAVARQRNIWCEVSLENMMACGLGACLCCVEKTVRGNVCVCTTGPVFNIDELTW